MIISATGPVFSVDTGSWQCGSLTLQDDPQGKKPVVVNFTVETVAYFYF